MMDEEGSICRSPPLSTIHIGRWRAVGRRRAAIWGDELSPGSSEAL